MPIKLVERRGRPRRSVDRRQGGLPGGLTAGRHGFDHLRETHRSHLAGVSGDSTIAQVHQLDQMGIPVVCEGVINASHYGIKWDDTSNPTASELSGKLMAAWLIVRHRGATSTVFHNTPELPFSPYEQRGFDAEIKALCSACSVRDSNVPVADLGNQAPSLVVSDLQAHPQTNSVAFASEEAATGLPSALEVANLHPTITGFAPPPAVLGYIKSGEISSGLATDLPTGSFETVDVLTRLATHEPLVGAENNGPRSTSSWSRRRSTSTWPWGARATRTSLSASPSCGTEQDVGAESALVAPMPTLLHEAGGLGRQPRRGCLGGTGGRPCQRAGSPAAAHRPAGADGQARRRADAGP